MKSRLIFRPRFGSAFGSALLELAVDLDGPPEMVDAIVTATREAVKKVDSDYQEA